MMTCTSEPNHLFFAIASDSVDVAHVTAHNDSSGGRAKRN
jgi:hypothetical protein